MALVRSRRTGGKTSVKRTLVTLLRADLRIEGESAATTCAGGPGPCGISGTRCSLREISASLGANSAAARGRFLDMVRWDREGRRGSQHTKGARIRVSCVTMAVSGEQVKLSALLTTHFPARFLVVLPALAMSRPPMDSPAKASFAPKPELVEESGKLCCFWLIRCRFSYVFHVGRFLSIQTQRTSTSAFSMRAATMKRLLPSIITALLSCSRGNSSIVTPSRTRPSVVLMRSFPALWRGMYLCSLLLQYLPPVSAVLCLCNCRLAKVLPEVSDDQMSHTTFLLVSPSGNVIDVSAWGKHVSAKWRNALDKCEGMVLLFSKFKVTYSKQYVNIRLDQNTKVEYVCLCV